MRISVVIPALNEAARIENSVRRAWEAGADDVVVADGGSSDGTDEIARGLKCQLVITRRGRATQQNAAADVAQGDAILFLHADNYLPSGATDQIRSALKDPAVGHGAFRQRIDSGGIAYRTLEWGNAQRVRWLGLPYGDQGIFVRRAIFAAGGGFPEIPLMEDLALGKQLRRKAWPVLLDGPLHVDPRRWQRYGIVRQTLRNWCLVFGYAIGVSPERLAKFYARHDAK